MTLATGTTSGLWPEATGTAPTGSAPLEAPAPGHHPTDSHSQRERSKARLLASIKQAVADLVLTSGPAARLKNSDYLSRRLSHDYTYLANVFSEATGGTIEQYITSFG